MRRTVELLLAVTITGLLAFQLGSCGTDTVKRDRDTAYKLANHFRWQRDSTEAAQAKTDTITRTVIVRDRAAEAQRDSLISVLIYADSVFADTAATMLELRMAYAVQRARVTQVVTAYDSLQASTRDLIAAHAEERFRTNATLAAADSTIAGWKAVAEAERRNGWRRFTQGAFTGAIVVLLAAVAL